MLQKDANLACKKVSLFTREWIEMASYSSWLPKNGSPSLRGSGLKCSRRMQILLARKSPSLRGSGLKSFTSVIIFDLSKSPSLRGSGLKYWKEYPKLGMQIVSLFTREWIEITCDNAVMIPWIASPSLRGSGLKLR